MPPTLDATPAKWALPAPLSRAAVVAQDGRIIVAGGMSTGSRTVGTVHVIDPRTGATDSRPPMVQPVHDAAAALIAGRPVVLGGGSGSVVDAVQVIATGPHSTPARLPAPRADLTAVTVARTTYVIGGYDGHAAAPEVLTTTDGVQFTSIGRLPIPVRYPAIAAIGRAIYVFGGEAANGDSSTIQRIDLDSHVITSNGRLPVPLAHAVAAVIDGRVWILGGRASGSISNAIRLFDPGTGTVTEAGRLTAPVRDAAIVVLGGTGYLLGGESPAPSAAVVELHVGTPR